MNTKSINQVKIKLSELTEHYQKGRFSYAKELAKSITQQFPEKQIGWKILSALLKKEGNFHDALDATEKSLQLSPQDAETHYNLGLILQEIGRLEDAEQSYTQAIKLNPDSAKAYHNLALTIQKLGRLDEAKERFAKAIALEPHLPQAHNNLGNTLKKMGQLTEAESSYKNAIVVKPDYALAHNNLGLTQKKLRRFDEAKESFTKAIELKPNFAEAHNNLGNLFKTEGKLDQSITSLNRAIELKPEYPEALYNLSVVQSHANALDKEIHTLSNLLSIQSGDFHLRAGVLLGICKFLEGNFQESKKYLLDSKKILEKKSLELKNEQIYKKYLLKILKWHEDNRYKCSHYKDQRILHVLGESHSLACHQLCVKYLGIDFFCKSQLIKGCMQWHLGSHERNQYKSQFESILYYLPKSSDVLLTIGEIDCRLDSGIIKHSKKFPSEKKNSLIKTTIKNYLSYISKSNINYQHNIIIQEDASGT